MDRTKEREDAEKIFVHSLILFFMQDPCLYNNQTKYGYIMKIERDKGENTKIQDKSER